MLAGPSVGSFLAELGADVLKVEDLECGGDVTRSWRLAGEPDRAGRSTYFSSVNFGKRSLAVRWRHPRGLAVVQRLAREADVVIASFKPGRELALGLDYATLAAQNPGLIYAWVTGFGPTDPRPGYDMLLQAQTGWMAMNGHPESPPARVPVAVVDLFAGHQLKEGLLLALLQRERTGRGSRITVSLWEASLGALANQASNVLMEGHTPARLGSEHPNLCPYGATLACRDGEVLVAPGSDAQFAQLAQALGCPGLPATNPERVAQRALVVGELRRAAASWGRGDLLAELARRAVPASPVRDLAEVFEGEETEPLVMRQGPWAAVRSAAFAPRRELSAPPRLGEHTESVLRSLGEDVDELLRLGIWQP